MREIVMFSVANAQRHAFDWSVGCHTALSKSRLACAYMILYNSGKLFSKGDWVSLYMRRVSV